MIHYVILLNLNLNLILYSYIEAKNTLTNVLSAIEGKQWETVRNLGTLATQRLPLFLDIESER